MIKVCSSQYNYQYGNQIHFPYSIAVLYSYTKSKPSLFNNFKFEKTYVFRDSIDNDIKKTKDADILLCSCYVWNWEITLHLANEVKKINPSCLVIFGGPQVPNDIDGFFEKYPFVDILVHGEGEYILENIFNAYLTNKDFSNVNGISTKTFRTQPQERINDLSDLPSPYLTNDIWDLVDKIDEINWDVCWETNRGCPYQCTFCDWGSATFTKVRKFIEERLYKEIEWFGDNKIIYIDCCDANFGILQERDLKLASKLKEVALQKGFPKKVRPAWAKNTTEKILPIARELKDGGILGAVTLAVQSLDQNTLNIIKRANIKFDKFSDLTISFRLNDIPTYTEIIIGLPGETLESYKRGLDIIANTKIDTVFIYNCSVLPNAPMNEPAYREKYKIKIIRSPVMLVHSSIHKRGIQEYEDIVTSTYSYTVDELKEMRLYSWAFLTFQNLGILEYISRYYNQTYNIPFMKFYEILLECCSSKKSIFKDEYEKVVEYIDIGHSGKGWDHFDPNLGEIIWPIEEASWLRLAHNEERLRDGIHYFLTYLEDKLGLHSSKNLLSDLIRFQTFLLMKKDDVDEIKSGTFEYDWKNFFINNDNVVKKKNCDYFFKNKVMESDFKNWCREAIWFGRRSNKFKCNPEHLHENKDGLRITASYYQNKS